MASQRVGAGASSIIPSLLKRICPQIHCFFFFMARGMDVAGWCPSSPPAWEKSILSTDLISNSSLLLLQQCLASRIKRPSMGIFKQSNWVSWSNCIKINFMKLPFFLFSYCFGQPFRIFLFWLLYLFFNPLVYFNKFGFCYFFLRHKSLWIRKW